MTAQRRCGQPRGSHRPDDERPASGQRLAAYNSVWQLRVDLWWSIADAARRPGMPSLDKGARTGLRSRAVASRLFVGAAVTSAVPSGTSPRPATGM
jgi:hypothetical protein